MDKAKLYQRLNNWAAWVNHDAEIGPKPARCISIESRHIPESGDVWDPEPLSATPNAQDAEEMQKHIRKLGCLEQYALAIRWAGMPAVIKARRVGDHAMKRMADNAEILLFDMIRAS